MMSDKRYYVNCAGYLCDKDLSNTLSIFECADLLNRLAEENEQLRQFITKGRRLSVKEIRDNANENVKLKRENEQLREIVNRLEEAIEKRGYDSIDEFW